MAGLSDEELMMRAREGDADAFWAERVAASKLVPMRADAAQTVIAGEVDIAEARRVTAFAPHYN
ncbi:MAG: hypothetical protein AB7Y46_13525 [Armatimonadota bacterium]